MQQGMLVHSLLYPGAGIDIEQLVLDLHERPDPLEFKQAWSQVMARHAVLRTGFRWLNLKEPIQQVFGEVSLPWAEEDWTGTAAGQQRAQLLRFLDSDRRRGFDLSCAPLWRLNLIRLGRDEWKLLWTFHHAILEGRSFGLVLREVFQTCDALRKGEAFRVTDPPPFRDYIDWLGRQDFDRSAPFWRNLLKGFQASTPIAIDQISKVPAEQTYDRISEELSLSPGETSALRAMAEESKITMNTIVQGAWAIILSVYASEKDVVFGVIRGGPPEDLAGSREMVGLFVNTLPMRVQIDPGAPLIPWLKEIRTQWNALRAHGHTPLARIQSWSGLQGRSPLFETTVMYQRYQLDVELQEHTAGAVRSSELFLQTTNKLDFAVYDGAIPRLRLDFDHTRIERQLAHRLLLHTRNLLQDIAQNPHRTIGSLKLIDGAERTELLTRWNETAAPRRTTRLLDEMVRRRIAQSPDSVAIVHGDVKLTFRELGRRASLLAGDLRNRGLSAGSFAAILLNRSIESAVSALAVVMTGAAYIPIDPGCPIHRLEAILDDARPLMLIAHRELVRSLPPTGGPQVIILDDFDWTRSGGLENPPDAGEEQAAYLIYTSGSTGRPKGVVVPHRAIANHIQWMQQTFPLNAGDRVLQQTSFGFDVAVWEFFGALCAGATLVIPTDMHFDLARTLDTISREGITVLQLVPSLLRALLNAPAFARCQSLRHVFCGGEPMPDDLPGRFHAMLPASLHNMYGPTETTIDALYFTVPRDWTGKVPIGLPIPNTQAYVLDANLEPVPLGVAGELHIGGVQVAHGYHNQPALTKERFVADPFSPVAGAQLYKTGDIVRRRPDGNVEFLSRRDDQFKIRGVRGELGDVEAALLQFPYVEDCAVVLGGKDDGDKQLLAYVVMTGAETVEWLRHFLRRRLVPQHVPAIILVDEVARSPNGKVDRARLPPPPQATAGAGSQAAAFKSPIEASLARIWCELLQREQVEPEDNFFDLGGDSLLVATLIFCIEEATGVQLGMPEIFRSPVFSQMAQLLTTRSSSVRPAVLTIQEGAAGKPPVYFIYAGAHEFGLARMLGVRRNVYGVEVGWPSAWRQALERGDTSEYPDMERLVEPFCSTICAHAGSKPFVVAGYSFAGLMAFETARQLKARGARVDAVLLFDTMARPPASLRVAWNEMLNVWKGKTKLDWGALTRAARTFHAARPRQAAAAAPPQASAECPAIHDRDAHELSLAWVLMEKLYESIRKQYAPRELGCRGILVVANDDEETRARRSAARDLGWSEFFAGDLQIVTAAHHHAALPREYDRELELQLAAALDRLH